MHRLLVRAAFWGAVLFGVATSVARAESWSDGFFSEKGHDFGPVPRGAKVRHNFVLTNRLPEPITILDVRASCGCTSGKASATTVAPGQTADIAAEMDTRNFVGPKATTLFVNVVTARGQQAEARLFVSSTILSDVVLNPGTIDFGAVARGESPSRTLTVERVGLPNWRVERMVSACRVIDASLVETVRSPATVVYTLTVKLKPDAPSGIVHDEIRIVTNDRETASIPITVMAQVRGDLSVKPSLLPLGNVTSAAVVQGRFLVSSSKPFAIQAVEGAGEGFRVGPTDNARKTLHVVTISYHPDEGNTRGDLRHAFRIVTDLPGEPTVEVAATLHVDP